MSTSGSSIGKLRKQASVIAAELKAAERGEPVRSDRGRKIEAARLTPGIRFGVVMDDKVFTVDMTWDQIHDHTEAGLTEYIVKLMRGNRDAVH